ncbi:MAG: bacillithiol biosynthesis BshC, partial [Riemerella sp.]|nr:bacillithiol biosynthesis BshC [Riemerella sp.]
MNKKEIFLKDIYSIPSLIKDFFADEEYASHRFSLENVQKQVELKEKSYSKEQREILYKIWGRQILGNTHKEQLRNIEALHEENTFTIVTGHQLNLFTGPAFFVYKILQTIKTTDFLNQNIQGKKFVPIFWMATEDHDFEEINHFKTQNHIYSIDGKSGGAVGRIKVEKNNFIEEFEKEFKYNDFGKELIDWMKEAYAEGNTLAEATKTLVNKLFADRGLLMIDGDDR